MQKARKHHKNGDRNCTQYKSLPHFEQLEPRIMLSADSLLNVTEPDPGQNTLMESVQEVVQCEELSQTHEQPEESVQSNPSDADDYQPILTLCIDDRANEVSAGADLSINNIDSAQVNCDIAVLLDDSDADQNNLDPIEDGDMPFYTNTADSSVEYATSIEIRGPPTSETIALPGMHLVEPNVDNFDEQIVYLVFDGAENITYNGPILIEGIDIPVFSVPDHLAGQEQVIITNILHELNDIFVNCGIIFTIERPQIGLSYSTVYIGGDDSAFIAYGSFLGLAEQIDVGNQDPCDEAFVFSDNLIKGNPSAETLTNNLVNIISHEIGHLLGYEHDYATPSNGPLDHLASFGPQQVISTQADRAFSVYACDIDADGDNDILSASLNDDKIAWYENLGGGTFSTQQIISSSADGAHSVYACDLDGDGDNDVLSASYYDDKIAWYENLGSGTFGSQQVISTQAGGARSVYACDLDGDGDNDVLSASYDDGKIAWYENQGGSTFGSQQVISTQVLRAWTVYACDLDGDGDNDVFSASVDDDKIAWYENLGSGTFGGQQIITTLADGARSVYVCDLDDDGDYDVLSASYYDNKISWYENLGAGTFSIQRTISNQVSGAMSVYACDLDGDGDNDVLSASLNDDKIAWYENLGGGTFGSQQVITTGTDWARSVYACDLDNDGDNDVLSASDNDDKIAWYENLFSPGTGQPDIDVERNGMDNIHTHSFGTLQVGQTISQQFTVRNEGTVDLIVTQASGLASPFTINPVNNSGSADDWVIPPGGTQIFTLNFSPVTQGYYSDILVLNSNDFNEGNYQITVTGIGSTLFGGQQIISTQADRPCSVYACDLDGDGDNDVLSASNTDHEIAWYENLGSGTFSSQKLITTQAVGARMVYACDLDGDGDNDVLSASSGIDRIAWYENLGGGTFGPQQTISAQVSAATSVYASDLDGDGDNDVLSASASDDKIAWYENLGSGTFGNQLVISTQADGAFSVFACDLDSDGDNDVLSASKSGDQIAWYENLGAGSFGTQQIITAQVDEAY
jgi:hypothetical protein